MRTYNFVVPAFPAQMAYAHMLMQQYSHLPEEVRNDRVSQALLYETAFGGPERELSFGEHIEDGKIDAASIPGTVEIAAYVVTERLPTEEQLKQQYDIFGVETADDYVFHLATEMLWHAQDLATNPNGTPIDHIRVKVVVAPGVVHSRTIFGREPQPLNWREMNAQAEQLFPQLVS